MQMSAGVVLLGYLKVWYVLLCDDAFCGMRMPRFRRPSQCSFKDYKSDRIHASGPTCNSTPMLPVIVQGTSPSTVRTATKAAQQQTNCSLSKLWYSSCTQTTGEVHGSACIVYSAALLLTISSDQLVASAHATAKRGAHVT